MELRSKIKELRKTVKTTMIYVTHDQVEALTLSDYIAVMKDSRVVQFDTPINLYEHLKDTFVGYFIGNPGMNFIQCDIEEYKLDRAGFDYLPDKSVIEELLKHGNKAIIGIRPEYVKVNRKHGITRAKCIVREDLGINLILHLEFQDKSVIKSKIPYTDVREGYEVYVDFTKEKVRIFNAKGLAVM